MPQSAIPSDDIRQKTGASEARKQFWQIQQKE